MTNPQHTIDFLASSLDLLRGKIWTMKHWLESFVRAANVESTMYLRWGCGKPQQTTNTLFGRDARTSGWLAQLGRPHTQIWRHLQNAHYLNDLAESINRPELLEARPAYNPQILSAVIDWSPAFMPS